MWLDGRSFVRWRVRIAIGALALAGGIFSTVAIEDLALLGLHDVLDDPHPMLDLAARRAEAVALLRAGAVSTTALLAIGLAFGIGWPRWVAARTLLGCAVLGWINCAACLTLHAIVSPNPANGPPATAMASGFCFGIFIGAPLGVVYGAIYTFATKRLRRLLDRPTLSATWDASFTVGVTVLGSALFATAIAAARRDPIVPWVLPGSLAVAGASLTVVATLRARWLRRVGADPARSGLSRVALAELGMDADALLPLHDGVASTASHALVRSLDLGGGGAYRRARSRVAVALVD